MEETGEKYTEARRALLAADSAPPPPAQTVFGDTLRPGAITAVVCGGGLTNLAFALPTLLARRDAGHHLVTVAGERDNVLELPSPLDFPVITRLATVTEVASMFVERDERLTDLIAQAARHVTAASGQATPGAWRERLAGLAQDGTQPVVWVQDIQVAGPIVVPRGRSGFDEIPAQMDALRALARETGATIALGHCANFDHPDWELVASAADETFVINDDAALDTDLDRPRAAMVHHYRGGRAVGTHPALIDHAFADWRIELLRAEP
jgi:hypothetical protein